jgi:hypothetical protein
MAVLRSGSGGCRSGGSWSGSREEAEVGELADRVGHGAAPVGGERLAHAGGGVLGPGADQVGQCGGLAHGEQRGDLVVAGAAERRGGRQQHVEHAVVLLRDAVDGVGAAHGVVQPPRQLERHPETRAEPEEGRQLGLVGPRPGGGRAGAELGDDPAGLVAGGAHVGDGRFGGPAPGHLQGGGDVVEAEVAPPLLPGELDADDRHARLVAQGVEGRGRRRRVGSGAGDEDEVEGGGRGIGRRTGIPVVEHPHEVGDRGRGDQQRADAAGVPGMQVHGVAGDGLRQRGVAGWEHRGVVDERAQQHRWRRRHAPQPIASRMPARRTGQVVGCQPSRAGQFWHF